MHRDKAVSQDQLIYLGKNVRERQTGPTAGTKGKKTTPPGDWGVIGQLKMALTPPKAKARKPLGAS